MKHLVLLLAALPILAAPTLVQHKTGTTVTSLTFTSTTTAGNTLVLGIEQNSNSTTPITISSIANTGGDTWTRINRTNTTTAGNFQEVELWCAGNIAGHASDAVTITNSSSAPYNSMYIQEWSGLLAGTSCAGLIDTSAINAGSGANATTSALSVTTGELILWVAMFNVGSVGPGTGYTSIDSDTFSMEAYKVAASGSETPTAAGSSGNWAIVGGALKVTASTFHANQSVVVVSGP